MTDASDAVLDTVVVGAGVTGLSVADALHRAGRSVVVLEARDRTGGRLLSPQVDVGDGTSYAADLGASWSWPGEERVAALAQRLGTTRHEHHLDGDTVAEDGQGVRRFDGNLLDVPSWRFVDGAAALTDGLAAALPAGSVLLAHPVDQVEVAGDLLVVAAAGRTWRARQVVLALPPAVAAATVGLPEETADLAAVAAATPVWMGSTAKVVAVFDRPFWRDEGLAGAGVSRVGPLQELHDLSGPDGHPAALFGFAPAALLAGFAPEQVERAVRDQLARMFGRPGGAPRAVLVHDWSTEPWTVPAGGGPPGGRERFGHPLLRRPALGGRLHLASTETAAAYAGHVEGALAEAERVVAAVLAALPVG